ncbi:MAG: tyrosine-protein phosphatase [Muricomes sp.]
MAGLVNFRELGGMKTAYGTISKNRLFRSGELVEIGQEDINKLLGDHQLKMIVDFRDKKEVSLKPDVSISGVEYCHIDIMKSIKENTTNLDNISIELNIASADRGMQDIYKEITLDSGSRQGYHDFIIKLKGLAQGATIFHCFAGKDRTGIGAAIVLTILGANRDDIFEDYLQTNKSREAENDLLLGIIEKEKGLNSVQLEGMRRLLSVHESYLETMYRTVEESYGDFEGYIREGLNITDKDTELLRNLYLE